MDLASSPRTESAFSSGSSAPTKLAMNQGPALDCRSRGGSWISITDGSWRVSERGAARRCMWTFLPYPALRYARDIGRMFNIAPDHAIGLYFGLLALPLALIAIKLRPARHLVPGTVLAASVLMAMSGAIHLGLIGTHREKTITALLFLFNGVAYILLSVAFTWRWWRPASAALLVATLLGYLGYIPLGLDNPDQVRGAPRCAGGTRL